MIAVRKYWLQALLGLCAIATIALLAWPAGSQGVSARPPLDRYAGPTFVDRKAGALSSFPFRLASANAPEAAPPQAEALPALVGISGGQVYLRSLSTGEVERLGRGETLDGWRIVSISSRSVTLRGKDKDERLSMFAPVASGAASNEAGPMAPAGASVPPPATPRGP